MPPFGRIAANLDVIYPRYDPALFIGRQWLVDHIQALCDGPGARHIVLVGEPGAGKSAFLAYLAEAWNCPRHFIRADNLSGIAGLDPRAFLLSIGTQLFHKYGGAIFEGSQREATSVHVGLAANKAEIVGRLIEELHAPLPFLPPRDVTVHVAVALGEARVIGERVQKLVNTAWDLPESTLLHVSVLQPLQQLHRRHPDETVIILLDALDEAVQNKGVSILDVLPRPGDPGLPPNLRLVMTTRPSSGILTALTGADFIRLDDDARGFSHQNQADARQYIQRRMAQAPLESALAAAPQEQVRALIARLENEANFLYLFHYLNMLHAAAAAGVLDLAALPAPRDLDEIYRFFAVERVRRQTSGRVRFTIAGPEPERLLVQLRAVPGVQHAHLHEHDAVIVTTQPDAVIERGFALSFELGLRLSNLSSETGESLQTWVEKYMPVLGTLATAREAVGPTLLAAWAGVEPEYVVAVLNHLKEFLDELPGNRESRYRLYHSSFAEYLTDAARNRDFPLDAVQYHARIAAYYRHSATEWSHVDWRQFKDEPYPFRHLADHLVEAREVDQLVALLTASPQWMNVQFQMAGGDAAYRDAVELAIGRVTDPLEPKELFAVVGLHTARQMVAERAATYGDSALQILTYLGRTEEAVANARLRQTVRERFTGLSSVYQVLQEGAQKTPDLVDDLLRIVRSCVLPIERVDFAIELAGLVARFGDPHAGEVIAVALEGCRSIKDLETAEDKFGKLAIALASAALVDQTITIVSLMPTEHGRSSILRRAAQVLGDTNQLDAAESVLASIPEAFDRDQARHQLACSALQSGDLDRAQALVTNITANGLSGEWASEVFGELALTYHHRGDTGRTAAALDEAWRQAQTVENPYRRSDTFALLGSVLGRLHDPRARSALERALAFVVTSSDRDYLARTIGYVAAGGFFSWAYALVLKAPPESKGRKEALARIALALADHGRYAESVQAMALARYLRGTDFNRDSYCQQLAIRLATAGEVEACLQVIRMIDHAEKQYDPRLALATWFVQHEQAKECGDLVSSVRNDWDNQFEATRSLNRLTSEMPFHNASADAMRNDDSEHDRRRKNTPLMDLAEALADAAGRPDHWAFELALSVAREIRETWEQAEALRRLALCLARWHAPGVEALFDEAQAADSRWATFYERRTLRLQQLARRLAEAGDFAGAESLLPAIPAGRQREFVQRYVAAALARAGHSPRAEQLVAEIEYAQYRREALQDVAIASVATGSPRASTLLRTVLRTLPAPEPDSYRSPPHVEIVAELARLGRYELAAALARAGLADPAHLADDARVNSALEGLLTEGLQSSPGTAQPPPPFMELLGDVGMRTETLFTVCLQAGWLDAALEVVRRTQSFDRQAQATQLVSALIRAERYAEAAQAAALSDSNWLLRRAVIEAVVDRAVRHGFTHQGIDIDIAGVDLVKPLVEKIWKHAEPLDLPGLGVNDINWDSLDDWQALIYLLPGLLPRSLFADDSDMISAHDYDKRHDVYALGIALAGKALLDQRRYDDVVALVASTSTVLYRDAVLCTLSMGLAEASRFPQARGLIAQIGYPERYREAVQFLSDSLARDGRFAEALRTREWSTLDEQLESLQRWVPFMERLQPGVAVRCVAEAARLAGWIRPDWRELGQALAAALSSSATRFTSETTG